MDKLLDRLNRAQSLATFRGTVLEEERAREVISTTAANVTLNQKGDLVLADNSRQFGVGKEGKHDLARAARIHRPFFMDCDPDLQAINFERRFSKFVGPETRVSLVIERVGSRRREIRWAAVLALCLQASQAHSLSLTLIGEEPRASVSFLQLSLGRGRDHGFRALDFSWYYKGLGLGLGLLDERSRSIPVRRIDNSRNTRQVVETEPSGNAVVFRGSWVPLTVPVIRDQSGSMLSAVEIFYEHAPPWLKADRFDSFGVKLVLPFVTFSYQNETTWINRPWLQTGTEVGSASQWRASMQFSVFLFQGLIGRGARGSLRAASAQTEAAVPPGPAATDDLTSLRAAGLDLIREGRRRKGLRHLGDSCRRGLDLACRDLRILEAQEP